MYDAPGLRLLMETFGPGYSYTVNSLESPAGMFISDAAAAAVADSELALEKSQASRGALILQPNEASLYGYIAEWQDALAAFEKGEDALLNLDYGRLIVKLIMASYMSHEKKAVVDLTDPDVSKELDTCVPLIQQGRGGDVFFFWGAGKNRPVWEEFMLRRGGPGGDLYCLKKGKETCGISYFKGIHRWKVPNYNIHPAHTWLSFCTMHNRLVEKPHKGIERHTWFFWPAKPYYSANVTYIDGHVKFHGPTPSFSFNSSSTRYIANDACWANPYFPMCR